MLRYMPALGKKKKKEEIRVPRHSLHSVFRGYYCSWGKAGAAIDGVALRKPVRGILCPESHFGQPEPADRVILCEARR